MIDKVACITEFIQKANQLIGRNYINKDILDGNLKKLLSSFLSHMDLVTREEFDAQVIALQQAIDKLESLEKNDSDAV